MVHKAVGKEGVVILGFGHGLGGDGSWDGGRGVGWLYGVHFYWKVMEKLRCKISDLLNASQIHFFSLFLSFFFFYLLLWTYNLPLPLHPIVEMYL